MQRSTFKVLFYVKRQSKKSGQAPVMGPYYDKRYDVAVQLQTLRSFFSLGSQSK